MSAGEPNAISHYQITLGGSRLGSVLALWESGFCTTVPRVIYDETGSLVVTKNFNYTAGFSGQLEEVRSFSGVFLPSSDPMKFLTSHTRTKLFVACVQV